MFYIYYYFLPIITKILHKQNRAYIKTALHFNCLNKRHFNQISLTYFKLNL